MPDLSTNTLLLTIVDQAQQLDVMGDVIRQVSAERDALAVRVLELEAKYEPPPAAPGEVKSPAKAPDVTPATD